MYYINSFKIIILFFSCIQGKEWNDNSSFMYWKIIDDGDYYEISLRMSSISYYVKYDKKNNKLVEANKYKINYLIFKEKITLSKEEVWVEFRQLWMDYLESKIQEKKYKIEEINSEIRKNAAEIKFLHSLN